mmetsp:Transcript_57975/g.188619  ORF Transcript_57975/g.188619 Transcript_57975/m.188619 type:complete len:201 (+) Transcript_57975:1374-1976(+)
MPNATSTTTRSPRATLVPAAVPAARLGTDGTIWKGTPTLHPLGALHAKPMPQAQTSFQPHVVSDGEPRLNNQEASKVDASVTLPLLQWFITVGAVPLPVTLDFPASTAASACMMGSTAASTAATETGEAVRNLCLTEKKLSAQVPAFNCRRHWHSCPGADAADDDEPEDDHGPSPLEPVGTAVASHQWMEQTGGGAEPVV